MKRIEDNEKFEKKILKKGKKITVLTDIHSIIVT